MFRQTGMQLILLNFVGLFSGLLAWDKVYVNFDGSAYLTYGLLSKVSTSRDNFKLLFRTINPTGVILHAGSATDFITLELLRGKLRYTANFGTTQNSSGYHEVFMGNHLANNEWHQVELRRTGLNLLIILDVTRKTVKAPGSYDSLELEGNIYIAGVDNVGIRDAQIHHNRRLPFMTFVGCLQDVILNGKNILKMARDHDISTQLHGGATFGCPLPAYKPITFTHPKSHLLLPVTQASALSFSFKFRTYDAEGTLLIHRVSSHRGADVFLSLVAGSVKLEVVFPNPRKQVRLQAGSELNDGWWHWVAISVSGSSVSLKVDKETDRTTLDSHDFNHNSVLHIGGNGNDLSGFIGCMYDVKANGRKLDISKATTTGILIDKCAPVDHCLPNPCQHGGRCTQRLNKTSCACAGTYYSGKKCEVPAEVYKETCADWKAAGKTTDAYYKISPGGVKPYMVYCSNMDTPDGPATVIDHAWGRNPVRAMNPTLRMRGFYFHTAQYETDLQSITALITRSTHCRQHLRYNCINSVLFDSAHDFDLSAGRGARWISREDQVMDYWAGATPGSEKCACGVTNTCFRHDLACNCDASDSVWRSDGGYITDMYSLPVKRIMFNARGTGSSSNYTLGRLECFGSKQKPPTTKPATTQQTIPGKSATSKIPETTNTPLVKPIKTDFIPTHNGLKTSPTQGAVPTTETGNVIPDRPGPNPGPTTESDKDYNNPGPPVIIVDSPRKFITIRQNSNQELILIILSIILAIFIIAIIVLMLRQNLFLPCKCLEGPIYRDVRNIDSVELGPPSSLFTNVDTEIMEYETSPFPPRNFEVGYLDSDDIVVVQSRIPRGVLRDDPSESDEDTDRLDFSNESSSPTESQTDGKDGMEQTDSKEEELNKMAHLKSPDDFVVEVEMDKLKEALYEVLSATDVNVNNNPIGKDPKDEGSDATGYESKKGNTIDRYGMDFIRPPPYRHIDDVMTHAQRADSELSVEFSTRSSGSCSCDELSVDDTQSPSSSESIHHRNRQISSDVYPQFEGNTGHIHLHNNHEVVQYYCSYEPEGECPETNSTSTGYIGTRTCERSDPVRPEQQALLDEVPDESRGCSDTCEEGSGCSTCERSTSDNQSSDSSVVTTDVCSSCSTNECECESNNGEVSGLITQINYGSNTRPSSSRRKNGKAPRIETSL